MSMENRKSGSKRGSPIKALLDAVERGQQQAQSDRTDPPSASEDQFLTPTEVAAHLKLAVGTVYNMISDGRIPVYRINRRCVRVRHSELERWLAQYRCEAVDSPALAGQFDVHKRASA